MSIRIFGNDHSACQNCSYWDPGHKKSSICQGLSAWCHCQSHSDEDVEVVFDHDDWEAICYVNNEDSDKESEEEEDLDDIYL